MLRDPQRLSVDHAPRRADAIVIGASAGAVESLSELLPPLSVALSVPVVVVVHLPPRRPSVLPGLFQTLCSAPVAEPVDKQPVAAGTIWFAPPDYHLLIERDHTFALSVDPPVKFSRPSLDVLFESAADCYGARLAAVVLTGASDDGARGAQRVRAAGGHVLVQDPALALARTMPEAAIELADPQFVGGLAQIAATLRDLTGVSP
jgi:two-component system, chemotaxis family, protein-glutamate methylesterase/glutaminase